jgi:hypothetical protein
VFTYPGATARSLQLRTYLTGVGATAALTAGALVAFLSLAPFLAFKGLPSGAPGGTAGTAYLDSVASGAPTAAGAALGAARAAVARDPVPGSRGGGGGGSGSGSGGGSAGLGGAPINPPSTPVTPPPGASPSPSSSTGPVESGVNYLNQATSSLGVTVPSGPASTADGASSSTLNSAQPGLGDQVSDTGSSLVNGLRQP